MSSDQTYKSLGEKYGLADRTIQSWVRAYRKTHPCDNTAPVVGSSLAKQLEHSELKIELLEEILKIAEEQTGIDFKKKFGARRS